MAGRTGGAMTTEITLPFQHLRQNSHESQSGLPDESSDAAIITRVLSGERAAFETLVRRHQTFLFRRARWMGLDPDTAADMVQDTFIKAYTNLNSCRDRNHFGFWIGQILRNRILDFLKSADRRGVPLSVSLAANSGDPEAEVSRRSLHEQLQAALAELPDEQREAFLMKHAEGCSYEEMAELADASVSAMKMRVLRAREALRARLHGLIPASEM